MNKQKLTESLIESEINKEKAIITAKIIVIIKNMVNSEIETLSISNNKTILVFSNSLDNLSKRRLNALDFNIESLNAIYNGSLNSCLESLTQKISSKFKGCSVENLKIDEKSFNITATINNIKNVECDLLENFG